MDNWIREEGKERGLTHRKDLLMENKKQLEKNMRIFVVNIYFTLHLGYLFVESCQTGAVVVRWR